MFFPSSSIIYYSTATLPSHTHTQKHLLNTSVKQVLSAGVEGDDCIVQENKIKLLSFKSKRSQPSFVKSSMLIFPSKCPASHISHTSIFVRPKTYLSCLPSCCSNWSKSQPWRSPWLKVSFYFIVSQNWKQYLLVWSNNLHFCNHRIGFILILTSRKMLISNPAYSINIGL